MSALIWLPMRSQYWADNDVELMANGTFEGAAGPPPASWNALNVAGTREAGARTGGTGSYVGRSTYNGSASGGFWQISSAVGRRVHQRGWARADGATTSRPYVIDGIGNAPWTGAASSTWQNYDVTFINGAGVAYLYAQLLQPGGWVEYDDNSYIEQFMYTENLGSLKDKVQLGDGRTAATFPVFLSTLGGKRGFNTAPAGVNNVMLNHPTFPAMGSSGSIVALVYFSPLTISEATTHVLAVQAVLSADYSSGWLINQLGGKLYGYWGGGATVANADITPGVHSIAMTNDGSLVRIYVDGVMSAVTGAPSGPSIVPGLGIGGVSNAGFNAMHGCTFFGFGVYPYALSATQIRDLGNRMRLEANT